MTSTELADFWLVTVLPLASAVLFSIGMILVTASMVISWIRRAVGAA